MATEVREASSAEPVRGTCDPRFERVREEFARNFAERRELGAAACVIVDGEPVVDLWGGFADARESRPWEQDTMNVIMSCSKGVVATAIHMLIDRGELDIDRPIAHYWPEFAQNGKGAIPVRWGLSHQSGVAHIRRPVPAGRVSDFDLMVEYTAETAPYWEPGTKTGYHGMTIGWIMGELIRRITGKTPGAFLRDEIAAPLGGLDVWLGLPAEHEHRVADTVLFDIAAEAGISQAVWAAMTDPFSRGYKVITAMLGIKRLRSRLVRMAIRQAERRNPGQGISPIVVANLLDPTSPLFSFLTNAGDYLNRVNDRASHAGEIPAAGAIATARGLAGVYAPLSLGGAHNGLRLVSEAAIDRMRVAQSVTEVDALIGGATSYTLGYSKSWPNPIPGNGVIVGEEAFGTPGAGGQIGFADPSYRLAFAYIMNRHGAGTGINERGQSLVDAAYESLGSPGKTSRYWSRPAAAL